jgi:hypothetical protein
VDHSVSQAAPQGWSPGCRAALRAIAKEQQQIWPVGAWQSSSSHQSTWQHECRLCQLQRLAWRSSFQLCCDSTATNAMHIPRPACQLASPGMAHSIVVLCARPVWRGPASMGSWRLLLVSGGFPASVMCCTGPGSKSWV